MISPYKIVRECLLQLEQSRVYPLKKLALVMHLNRLLPELQGNRSGGQITDEYKLLTGKVYMLLREPENVTKLKDLDEHLQSMLRSHGRAVDFEDDGLVGSDEIR